MIPPTFQIDDEVENANGTLFKISQLWKKPDGSFAYSDPSLRWCSANELRLVNKKPLSPMHITYNYKPDDCEHGTIQVSCPCGRKAEIDPKLDEELKIGDWAQVINPKSPDPGKIFKITDKIGERYSDGHSVQYLPKNLRKLTPDEIKQHANKPEILDELAKIVVRLQDDAKIARPWIDGIEGQLSAIEKRLDFVEKFQRGQANSQTIGPFQLAHRPRPGSMVEFKWTARP